MELTSDRNRDDAPPAGVLISGHDPVWAVGVCLLLGFSGLGMGALMALRALNPPALVMLAMGVGLTFCGVVVAVVLNQRRRHLQPTAEGFVYFQPQGERGFHDDDVMCVSLSSRENYFWGNLQSVTRRFIIWVETSSVPERIICISHLKSSTPDPLRDFVARIINGLHTSALDAYHQGERVEGDGWALERGQLMLTLPRATAVIPIEDLSVVDIVDDHVNVWRRGHDLPIGRIPVPTANSHLLLLLFNDLVSEQAAETEASLPSGGLGRMIFERRLGSRSGEVLGWMVISILCLLTLMFIIGAVFERRPRRRMRQTVAAMVLGSLSIAGSSLLSRKRRTRFRRHAFGIHQRGMFSERRLRFTEIANLSYVALRRYSHGIYNGTVLNMRFRPMPGKGLQPISFSAHVQNTDGELDRLRDEISLAIAARMKEFWTVHGTCPWIPFLQFQKDGLDYCRLTFTGRKQPVHIPFSSIVNFDITDGTFHIWAADERKPVISEETSQPNFFPGLMLFSNLLNRELSAETVHDAAAEPGDFNRMIK